MPEWMQRLLRRGPKYGVARGVAVLGPDFRRGADRSIESLGPSDWFRSWAARQGVELTGSPESLECIEAELDDWYDSDVRPRIGNDLGLYLGEVLSRHVAGARWVAWPNGHPVIRLGSGTDIDVVEEVRHRLGGDGRRLPAVFAMAMDR